MNQVIEDRYEIQGYLGQGGMGEVYRALDRHTRDIVAVKSLKADVVKLDPEILARFEREGDALRKLNHPNIVKMLSTCNSDGRHYIVMEYVGGGSLRDLLDDQPRLPVDRVLQIGLDVADALTRAHRLNITHRDIKPENILLAEDGTPRLTDFGVAQMGDSPRMTQAGALVGTLSYLSPEGASGEAVDERADIWSFGLVLYEMLAGQMPFQKPQIGATLNAILNQPTPDLQAERPDVPDALADLIYRMLIKERAARIPSVRLVGAEIEALLHGRESTSQIYGDSTRFGTPAPSSVDVTPSKIRTPSNLPAQTTPFVGRDEELLDILRLLADESVRLITVSGPGGMGKTRLTLEAARLVLGGRPDSTSATLKQTSRINLPSFQHGVFFVPLAPLNAADVIVPTIAESINFAFYNADDPKTQLLNYLREKEMLLVMDNFEHLMDGANIVADILRAAPQVQILVSSRERLRLQGETILDLYGMRFPEYETPRELENYAAVKLFLQSARRAAPDFTLNEQTAPLVARIVRLVEGLPLGIELAAAWLEALSAQEIVQEMQRSFDFLETDLRDVPDRHRSIRSVFEYSWKLLTEAEKTAFGKLSVFRGGFTREAAQTVAEVALRDLTTLVNKSLLRRSPEGRYDVHELLRQYAAEHLRASPTEAEATHTRHSAYFMRLLAQCEKELYTSSQKRILEALETDFDNIRSAWQWASDHALEDLLYEGIGTLSALYETLSMFKEGVETFGKAADLLLKRGAAEDDLTVWRLRVYQGALAGRMGDYALNYQLAQQALNVFQHWDMRPEISYALNNLAYVDMMRGRYDSALEYGEQAMTMAVEVGDQWRVFMSMGNVG